MWSAEASIEVNAGRDRLWALFTDVKTWPSWNAGIEHIELRGPFASGTEFVMKPPGMEAFNSTLTDVRPGQSFTDVTVLDGTTVKVGHSLEKLDEHRTRVIYHTDVLGQAEAEIGSMVTEDFDDILKALKQLAESSPLQAPQEPAGTHMGQAPTYPNEDHIKIMAINAPDAPRAMGSYAQACQVVGASRLLFVSGQVPLTRNDELPSTFREQCRLAWANVEAQLRAADMELTNLIKVTIFLSDREFAVENRTVRQEILGLHSPALTVIIAGIFDEAWLLEIEAIAAA